MLQEDSNGEATFEIIDKKNEEIPSSVDKTESFSSMSSSASLLPSPGISLSNVPGATGNLLSNVAPPSALPSFIPTPIPIPIPMVNTSISSPPTALPTNLKQTPIPQYQLPPMLRPVPTPPRVIDMPLSAEPYSTQFSTAIPSHKEVEYDTIPQTTPVANEDSGGLFGWVKGAVASGGILSKVAEKAKHSVDSMIITLDPQMRGYIYSGGDLDILVASDKETKISPIQEAFQAIFGKATVKGVQVQVTNIAAQPVGFAAGVKAAEERIQEVFKTCFGQPVVAVENFLLEVGEDKWYDLGVLILNDPVRQITLQTFTQMTPIPASIVTLAQEDTPADYPLKWSGYAVTIGSLMARNLSVGHTEWHHALTGVSRKETILLAAKTLASLYKNTLSED